MNKQKGLALSQSKGFTIIELIVVIAIIAVLAAIVLFNVTIYISKSKNAAIKGNMATLMTNSTLWNANKSTYSGFTTDNITGCGPSSPIQAQITKNGGGTIVSAENANAWCACVVLNNTPEDPYAGGRPSFFCVDSTGKKSENNNHTCPFVCLAATPSCQY